MILITGGLGFIGSHLIAQLSLRTNKIICIDSMVNSNFESLVMLRKLVKNEFLFFKMSLNDPRLNNIFKKYKITSVIHCAGLKSVGESVKFPSKYYYNNVLGTINLLKVVKKYNVHNFIFSSSATVYGKPLRLPISELHPLSATNPYAQNKISIEKLLMGDSFFNLKCSTKILRYFNPVGAHPSGVIGENPKGIPNNLMPYILKVATGEFKLLNIYGNDYDTHDGSGVRDYIHVMDLVEGHIKSLNYNKIGITTLNLGTGKGYSVLDLVKTFENVNNIEIPYKFTSRRPGDVDTVFADPSKACETIGFKTQLKIDSMCKDSWNFAKNHFKYA